MALAGLHPGLGGKVIWSPRDNVVVWSSPDSDARSPDWTYFAPIPLVTTVFKVAGNTSFANPGDWNDASNKIECMGSGGSGSPRNSATRGGTGGGGGAYAARVNVSLLASGDFPVTISVPNPGLGTKTNFNAAHAGREVVADAGISGTTGGIAGTGGKAVNSIGDAGKVFSGGNGVASVAANANGGSGGGAAGPNGNGSNGGAITGANPGGAADNSTVAGGSANAAGNSGTEFDGTHGCGSGAGTTTSAGSGHVGGDYGGGGSGANDSASGNLGGLGGHALIIITYTPIVTVSGSVSETGNAASTQSATVKASRTVAETGSAASTQSATVAVSGSIAETGAAASTQSAATKVPGSLAESGAAVATQRAIVNTARGVAESGSAADIPSAAVRAVGSVSESGAAIDAVHAGLALPVAVTESLAATDVLAGSAKPGTEQNILGGRSAHRLVSGRGEWRLPHLRLKSEIIVSTPKPTIRLAGHAKFEFKASGRGAHGTSGAARARLLRPSAAAGGVVQASGSGRHQFVPALRASGRHDHFTAAEIEALAPLALLMLGD